MPRRSPFVLFAALACAGPAAFAQTPPSEPMDPVAVLVGRLDLEKYKATIKGLTQFGDRRQGTARNRQALDWIEAQLRSYGCTNTERLQYEFTEPVKRTPAAPQPARAGGPAGQGGSTLFGQRGPTGVNTDPMAQADERLRALHKSYYADVIGRLDATLARRMSPARRAGLADAIVAAVDGISIRAALEPEDWPPERQRRTLALLLTPLFAPGPQKAAPAKKASTRRPR